jgi:hypothetical protein
MVHTRKARQLLWILRTWCRDWAMVRSKVGGEVIDLVCVCEVMQRDG